MHTTNSTKTRFGRTTILIVATLLLAGFVPGCSDDDPTTPATATNTAPVSTADSYFVIRGATLTAGTANESVLANDTDADGNTLTAVLVTPPTSHVGTFALDSDGTFTYVHDGDAYPSDSFTNKTNDVSLDSPVVTVTITGPVVADDSAFGVDTITLDLATGLRWLDVTLSTAYSHNGVILEFGAGGEFEGYRLATGAEVKTLWANAGVDIDLVGFVSENFLPVVDLMVFCDATSHAGNLGGGNFFDYTAGHVVSEPGGASAFVYTLSADPDPTVTGRQGFGTVPSDNDNLSHGAWLIAVE